MKPHTIALSLLATLLPVISTQAQLVVDWGGTDYLPSTTGNNFVNLRGGGTVPAGTDTGNIRTWAYNDVTPLSPASPAYSGPTFFGALQFDYGVGPANFTTARINNQGTAVDISQIQISTPVNSGPQQNIAGFLAFKKADFINGGATNAVSIAAGNTITLNTSAGAGGTNTSFRGILQHGGTWYLSQSSVSGNGTVGNRVIDLTSNWAIWDQDNTPLDAIPGSFAIASSTFTDIQAIGFYFSGSRTNSMEIRVNNIDIDATVIPEPSTWALLAATGALVMTFRRRRKA